MFWIPNGANPLGIFGSINFALSAAAAVEVEEKVLSHTAILPFRKLVAYRKSPLLLLPIARPLYTGSLPVPPFTKSGLGTTVTASVIGLKPPCQAAIVPSSVAQMKRAGAPPTRNAIGLPFQTMPEGPGAPAFVSPAGEGIVTVSGILFPVPS